jgi:hypothetical protein
MSRSLRALLTGIVDYAGLFPPAKLPLDQALPHYASYRAGPDRWMLGRFILPAARLGELTAFEGLLREGPPFVLSALGRGGKTAAEFLAGLEADLAAITAARDGHAGRVEVDVLEVKLPDDVVRHAARNTLAHAVELLERLGPPHLSPFFEIAFDASWRATLDNALGLLAEVRLPSQQGRPPGFKLRCGGLEAAAFPTPEQIATTIVGCRDRGLALKATAGLHHPVRRFDASVQTHMHGFVNVFGAAVLAAAHHAADEELLGMMLVDEEPGHFTFGADGLAWGDLGASVAQIETARRHFALAFGSCSFDEPRDDLRALGWLAAVGLDTVPTPSA